MGRVRGSQTNLTNTGTGLKQQTDGTYAMEIDPGGGLQLGALGLKVKSGGIVSSMIAAGAIVAAHIGFDDADIPNTSALPGATIKDAMDGVSTVFADYVKHDGTVAMSANLNLGNKKIINMAKGTTPNEAVTLLQLQEAILLQNQQLYSCAYAGVGTANGALRVFGTIPFVRASQTVFISVNPAGGDTITFYGATLAFGVDVPIGGSAAVTAANLAAAINASMTPTSIPWGTALKNAVYAVRESTGLGQSVHVVWKDDDLNFARTPTDANGHACATSVPAKIKFVATDPSTGLPAFYGAYDLAQDGSTVQARHENAIYTYNEDQGGWILTFANPGSGFFSGVIGDLGGLQTAGPAATLLIEGSTTIGTVSGFFAGPKVTLSHKDASALATPFHSEDSIKLRTAYPNVGTGIGDTQADFDGAADVLLGNLRGAALQNVLVNGSFLIDPSSSLGPYNCGTPAATVIACMPGWALRDNDGMNPGNTAVAWWDNTSPVPPVIGPAIAGVNVTALGAVTQSFDFYQPILLPAHYSGRDVTFRCAVYSTVGSAIKVFIRTSMGAGYTYGTTHTGAAGWEVLEVSTTLNDPETIFEVGIQLPALDQVYVDACTCIVGASITGLPFIAKQIPQDMAEIHSMFYTFIEICNIWAVPGGGGPAVWAFRSAFPTMCQYPTESHVISSQPVGANCTVTTISLEQREVRFSISEATAWVAPIVLPNTVEVSFNIDARPT